MNARALCAFFTAVWCVPNPHVPTLPATNATASKSHIHPTQKHTEVARIAFTVNIINRTSIAQHRIGTQTKNTKKTINTINTTEQITPPHVPCSSSNHLSNVPTCVIAIVCHPIVGGGFWWILVRHPIPHLHVPACNVTVYSSYTTVDSVAASVWQPVKVVPVELCAQLLRLWVLLLLRKVSCHETCVCVRFGRCIRAYRNISTCTHMHTCMNAKTHAASTTELLGGEFCAEGGRRWM